MAGPLSVAAVDEDLGWQVLPNSPVAYAPPGAAGRHVDLSVWGPDTVWVANVQGEVHRTTNGGETWSLLATVPCFVRSIGFASSQRGWLGCLYGNPLLYETSDGGAGWSPVTGLPASVPGGICGISVVDRDVIYAAGWYRGSRSGVLKTTDGGATWAHSDVAPHATALVDCHFFDPENGIVVGSLGDDNSVAVVLATTDGGATWHTRHTTDHLDGSRGWKISFPTRDVGYVSVEPGSAVPTLVLKTTDGGSTWAEVPFIAGYNEQGVGFATPSLGWVGGWSGPTYETTDGGGSWHLAGFGQFVNRIRFLSSELGYAVGHRVYKYTKDPTTVAARPGEDFPLNAYPNPTRNWTRISFPVDAPTEVRVTIHDAQGRRIATAFRGRRPPGVHDLAWNTMDERGTPVSPGVYWLRVESKAGVRATSVVVVR